MISNSDSSNSSYEHAVPQRARLAEIVHALRDTAVRIAEAVEVWRRAVASSSPGWDGLDREGIVSQRGQQGLRALQ